MGEFPYKLEYRRINGEETPYSVYIPNGNAIRASMGEIKLFGHIAALEAENARLRAEIVRLQGVSKANSDRAVEFWNDRQQVFAELEDRRAEVKRLRALLADKGIEGHAP